MRLSSLAIPAGACVMGGTAAFVTSSPAFEILAASGVLLAAAPIVGYVLDIWRPHDPYRQSRHTAD